MRLVQHNLWKVSNQDKVNFLFKLLGLIEKLNCLKSEGCEERSRQFLVNTLNF